MERKNNGKENIKGKRGCDLMAYKHLRKINNEFESLLAEQKKIQAMKEQINDIDNLNVYNEQVDILNKMIDDYNERRNALKAMLR